MQVKKKFFAICAGLICLTFTGCLFSNYENADTPEESTIPKSSARIFLKEELEKKYGMEFEILGGSASLLSVAEDCDVRCVDDGIEFQATVHTKDYYEVESENYLLHKYLPQVQAEVEVYMQKYLSDFKYVEIRADTNELPFSTSPNLTYEELKQETYFECTIYVSENRIFSEEEMQLLVEKFASNETYIPEGSDVTVNTYRQELGMDVRFYIFTVVDDTYKELNDCMKWTEATFLGKKRLL